MNIEQFEAKCMPVPESGCWIWMGRATDRYGQTDTTKNGKRVYTYAHRISYELYTGLIPDGMLVCHRCDVGLCVNPAHLFLGTHEDNTLDMVQKGRNRYGGLPHPKGQKCSWAKLTDDQAQQIRHSRLPTAYLAECYGVSKNTIRAVRRGERYKS